MKCSKNGFWLEIILIDDELVLNTDLKILDLTGRVVSGKGSLTFDRIDCLFRLFRSFYELFDVVWNLKSDFLIKTNLKTDK